MPLTVYVPYARAGHYFYLGSRDKVLLSIFPWAGAEYDITRGTVVTVVIRPAPPYPVDATSTTKPSTASRV